MTTLRLAWTSNTNGIRTGLSRDPDPRWSEPPALLVSYWYLREFDKRPEPTTFRDWVMDSGAYSAANSGVTIDLAEYIDVCRQRLADDSRLTEVFALDVIGDWRGTLANTERMWEEGIPAIPTYHVGEPEHVLKHLAANYPKIAFGGAVGWTVKRKAPWVKACMARVWPKPVHLLGMGSEQVLLAVPAHTADDASWVTSPLAFGSWRAYGPTGGTRGDFSVRNMHADLRPEVRTYLDLERRHRVRWKREMTELADMLGPRYPYRNTTDAATGRLA